MVMILFFILLLSVSQSIPAYLIDPDEDRGSFELIESRGYFPQIHHVETKDSYILTLFRIVNKSDEEYQSKWSFTKTPKKPVVLQHGLLCSSDDWLIASPGGGLVRDEFTGKMMPNNNLGFVLAAYGYDVWLTNSRGNRYSRGHKSLNTSDHKFWDFSYDEMIEYDIPAVIDYVLNATKRDSLAYVGHSQGAMIMFGHLSLHPEESSKIKPFIALAPVTRVIRPKAPLRIIARIPEFDKLFDLLPGEFMGFSPLLNSALKLMCRRSLLTICTNLGFAVMGQRLTVHVNATRLPVYFTHQPAGTSKRDILHLGQNIKFRRFSKYDWNTYRNQEEYGASTPPLYPLNRINNSHIVLWWAQNDALATPEGVQFIRNSLKVKLLGDEKIPDPLYSHMDFQLGSSSGRLVFPKLLNYLKKYAD